MRTLPYFRNLDLSMITFDCRINKDDVMLCRESYGVRALRPANAHKRPKIPVWERSSLTIDEAAEYSGVGRTRLRELTDREDCPFVLWVGSKRLIRRKKLDEYLDKVDSI